MKTVLVLACILTAGVHSGVGGQEIAGVVLDAEGRALVGAEVARCWVFGPEGRRPRGACARTSEEGTFRIAVPESREPLTLVAFSQDGSQAGMAQVSEIPPQDVTIRLAAVARVEIRVRTAQDGPAPETVQVAWHTRLGGERLGPVFVQAVSWNGLLKCALPQGKYEWNVWDQDSVMRTGNSDLCREGPSATLEVILPPSFIARHMGKQLPEWTVSAARGLPLSSARLASFRGKWTFIEFWAYS